jgi:hypothetical protein
MTLRLDLDERIIQKLIDKLTKENETLMLDNWAMREALDNNYERLYHHTKKGLIERGLLRRTK